MNVTDHRIVVAENVAVLDARARLVVVAYHVLDCVRHCVDVHDDAGRKRDRVAFWRIDGKRQFADLLDNGRRGDVEGRRARIDEASAEPREDFLIEDWLCRLQFELVQSAISPGISDQPFGLLKHFFQRLPAPSERRSQFRLIHDLVHDEIPPFALLKFRTDGTEDARRDKPQSPWGSPTSSKAIRSPRSRRSDCQAAGVPCGKSWLHAICRYDRSFVSP